MKIVLTTQDIIDQNIGKIIKWYKDPTSFQFFYFKGINNTLAIIEFVADLLSVSGERIELDIDNFGERPLCIFN